MTFMEIKSFVAGFRRLKKACFLCIYLYIYIYMGLWKCMKGLNLRYMITVLKFSKCRFSFLLPEQLMQRKEGDIIQAETAAAASASLDFFFFLHFFVSFRCFTLRLPSVHRFMRTVWSSSWTFSCRSTDSHRWQKWQHTSQPDEVPAVLSWTCPQTSETSYEPEHAGNGRLELQLRFPQLNLTLQR